MTRRELARERIAQQQHEAWLRCLELERARVRSYRELELARIESQRDWWTREREAEMVARAEAEGERVRALRQAMQLVEVQRAAEKPPAAARQPIRRVK